MTSKMVRQQFHVRHYWKAIIYYNIDYGFLDVIVDDLKDIGFSYKKIKSLLHILRFKAKAVTCSNIDCCISIVLFNRHDTVTDYIDSIVHEAEHIKQSMLKVYGVEDKDEPPAYTIGYLVSKMYPVFRKYVCKNC